MSLKDIRAALAVLRANLPRVIEETQQLLAEPRLNLSITRWHETRRLEEELKQVRAMLTALNNAIADDLMPAQLDLHGLKSAPHALGLVKINHHFKALQKGQKNDVHEWLRANGLGALVVPTVNAQTLAAALKEPFAKGELCPPADLIECRVRRYASFTETGDENGSEKE